MTEKRKNKSTQRNNRKAKAPVTSATDATTTNSDASDAHAYRLEQARALLICAGYVEREDGSWAPVAPMTPG